LGAVLPQYPPKSFPDVRGLVLRHGHQHGLAVAYSPWPIGTFGDTLSKALSYDEVISGSREEQMIFA